MMALPSVAPRPDLIRLDSVSKTYRRDGVPVTALQHVDLTISDGEFTAIMGPSGSGKSTLLHILGLLDTEYEGTYRLGGQLVSGRSADELAILRNRDIGFVFQSFSCCPSFLSSKTRPFLPFMQAIARQRSASTRRGRASRKWASAIGCRTARASSPSASGSGRRLPGHW